MASGEEDFARRLRELEALVADRQAPDKVGWAAFEDANRLRQLADVVIGDMLKPVLLEVIKNMGVDSGARSYQQQLLDIIEQSNASPMLNDKQKVAATKACLAELQAWATSVSSDGATAKNVMPKKMCRLLYTSDLVTCEVCGRAWDVGDEKPCQ